MIKNITIHGLRGFSELRKIEFAEPNGELGSGITFLVGGNNSGKTTILEALRAYNCFVGNPPTFSERKRNKKCEDGRVHLSLLSTDDSIYSIDTAEGGGSPTVIRKNGLEITDDTLPQIFVLQSRRFVDYEFHQSNMDRYDYVRNQQSNYHNRSSVLNDFNARLFNMYKNKSDFDPIIKKILGYDLKWTIEQNENGTYYLKLTVNGSEHSSEGMGDGIWSIFTICDALYDSKAGDTIAIDEPELSLHPALQKKILYLIKEYAKDRQIIISTHSPYYIDIDSIVNGANLYRTVKNIDGAIEIYALSNISKTHLKGFLSDINQPHTFGTEARELFFLEDKVILVEGQEDVIMYSKAANDLGIELCGNFFGWGAGGAPKIPKVLQILSDLGYKKVAVIFDGDKIDEKTTIEKQYPYYSFFNITTDDIRDKKAIINRPEKIGMMTEKGELKSQYNEEMSNLLSNINMCFKV